jgi:hypothetical protein
VLDPVCGQSQPPEALQDEHEPPAEGVTIQWKCFPPAYPPDQPANNRRPGPGRSSVVAPQLSQLSQGSQGSARGKGDLLLRTGYKQVA